MLVAILAVSVGFAAAATLDRVRNTLQPQPLAQSSGAVEGSGELAGAGDVARVARDVVASTDAPEASTGQKLNNLSGGWTLTNRVEAGQDTRMQVSVGYRVRLQQRGVNVSGTGYRAMENGRIIPLRQRTPIAVEGRLDGRRLELLFTEHGAGATSGGTLVMRVTDDASMRGTFWSDASMQSRGSASAKRIAQ
jgi:hypothetical protein